jgi:4-oxalocrotonate tautomerase
MPYINVKVTAKSDPSLSARIARQAGELTSAHLHKDPTVTAVAVDYVDPQHWFVGGRSLAEQETGTYWLDIKVTAGTNTKQEMAAYLEAIHAFMSDTLGGISGTSYILVHEVPASNWGFGGKTQEFRFISGKLAKAG